jgi:hypothetical protein
MKSIIILTAIAVMSAAGLTAQENTAPREAGKFIDRLFVDISIQSSVINSKSHGFDYRTSPVNIIVGGWCGLNRTLSLGLAFDCSLLLYAKDGDRDWQANTTLGPMISANLFRFWDAESLEFVAKAGSALDNCQAWRYLFYDAGLRWNTVFSKTNQYYFTSGWRRQRPASGCFPRPINTILHRGLAITAPALGSIPTAVQCMSVQV